mgnify:FL=1
MNAKQKLAAEFVGLLKQQRKEHNERGRFLGYAERLAARIRLCGICGSSVGNGTTYSMLVSPQEDGLSVLICDNSHCYKTVLRDLSAVLRDRQIVLVGELGQSCGRIILDENDVLHCADYGTFLREATLLRNELHDMQNDGLSESEA